MEVEKGVVEQNDMVASQSIKEQSSVVMIDHVAERKLLRKLDVRIIPLVMALYLFVSKAKLLCSKSLEVSD